MPRILYGTAWKEDRTRALVTDALAVGFRGLDTATQRKHYHEAGVGEALQAAFGRGVVARQDVFVQSKFTHARGHDHRVPYDPRAPVGEQVASSFRASLAHLGLEKLDAYLLHGPATMLGLVDADREAWRAMEALHDEGRVGLLGVSNVTLGQLTELHALARVKPAIVQNRTFTRPASDRAVRAFCAEQGIAYQGFSLLTAIPSALTHPAIVAIADAHGRTPAEIVFAWCLLDMVVLTGTTSLEHMAQDLSVLDLALSTEERATLQALLG